MNEGFDMGIPHGLEALDSSFKEVRVFEVCKGVGRKTKGQHDEGQQDREPPRGEALFERTSENLRGLCTL